MMSLSMIPSSMSGTKAGQAFSLMSSVLFSSWIMSLYAWLAMVTLVPMMPTFLDASHSAATCRAVGSMMPRIGMFGNFRRRSSTQVALTVLQAMTIIFTLLFTRKSAISMLKPLIVRMALEPYGVLAVSPKYMIFSSGSLRIRYGMQVRPPSPESKKPIGLLSI